MFSQPFWITQDMSRRDRDRDRYPDCVKGPCEEITKCISNHICISNDFVDGSSDAVDVLW